MYNVPYPPPPHARPVWKLFKRGKKGIIVRGENKNNKVEKRKKEERRKRRKMKEWWEKKWVMGSLSKNICRKIMGSFSNWAWEDFHF